MSFIVIKQKDTNQQHKECFIAKSILGAINVNVPFTVIHFKFKHSPYFVIMPQSCYDFEESVINWSNLWYGN